MEIHATINSVDNFRLVVVFFSSFFFNFAELSLDVRIMLQKANKQNVTTRIFMVVGYGFGHSKINLLHFGPIIASAVLLLFVLIFPSVA